MGMKCVCDACGKEIRLDQPESGLASIAVTFSRKVPGPDGIRRPTQLPVISGPPGPPDYYLICSGKCIEKAMKEVQAYLEKAFDVKEEYWED